MKKFIALTLACALSAGLLLSGCAMDDPQSGGSSGSAGGTASSGKREVNICSWGEYIDTSLIKQFEEETGIKVNYQTTDSNETLYNLLETTGWSGFDVVVPSDYMISQLIEEGRLAELNYDNIPNFAKIDDRFKNLSYDPENKYTVPYTWGTLGIIYNTQRVTEPVTWELMFDPDHAGDVLMIRNSRDAFGIALMSLGYSVNTTDEEEIRQAYEKVSQANKDGVYQAFVMDEVFQAAAPPPPPTTPETI